MRSVILSLFSCASLFVAGCAMQSAGPATNATAAGAHGTVFGGQQPIAGSTITVWEVGTNGYGTSATSLATTTTDSGGGFSFPVGSYTCDANNAPLYITARGGDAGAGPNANIELIAVLGPCSSAPNQSVVINELTTVATVWAAQGFMSTTLGAAAQPYISGTVAGFAIDGSTHNGNFNTGLVNALETTAPMLVNQASGTTAAPVAGRTVEMAKIVTLANIIASCVNSGGQTSNTDAATPCGVLFSDTNAYLQNPRPYTTLQAALNIAQYPYYNVQSLFNRASANPPFSGSLTTAPNDWTLGVSYATSAMSVGINGTSNSTTSTALAVDAFGKVWFPSTMSTATGVGYFDPASGSFNGPYGGATLRHPQYIAIDQTGYLWATDMSSNNIFLISTNTASGIITNNFTMAGASAGGPLTVDKNNHPLFEYTRASDGSERLGQIITSSLGATFSDVQAAFPYASNGVLSGVTGSSNVYAAWAGGGGPCNLGYMDGTNSIVVYTSTTQPCQTVGIAAVGNSNYSPSSAMMTDMTDNALCVYGANDSTPRCNVSALPLSAPTGIAIDGVGDLWVANSGNNSITTQHGPRTSTNVNAPSYTMSSTVPYMHGANNGGTLNNPWALAIDGSGNVWTMSPGCVTTSTTPCMPTGMTLTQLIGAAAPTIAPLSLQVSNYTGTKPVR